VILPALAGLLLALPFLPPLAPLCGTLLRDP
jgi:hypothetical protein